jgi:anti-sigma factor RsiW
VPIESERHLTDEDLHALLDGELAVATSVRARAHLATCPTCPARLREIESVFVALKALPDLPVRRDLARGVLDQLALAPTKGRRWIWVLGAQAVAAGVLAVALGQPAAAEWLALASVRLQLPSTWWLELLAWPRAGWEALLSQAQAVLAYGPSLITQARPLPWPTEGLAAPALLTGLVVLWLAGNSLLLFPRSRGADAPGEA